MASFVKNFGKAAKEYILSVPKGVLNLTADLLENGDFISRTIGTNKSYNDIMFMIQSLGREPISLLGKDYIFIYDHVRRNYLQGTQVGGVSYGVPDFEYGMSKFTFYKEKPTIRFADVDNDPLNLLDRWMPNIKLEGTSKDNTLYSYAESDDDKTNNRQIGSRNDENLGVNFGVVRSYSTRLTSKDLIRKTNENFNHGRYRTLVARFHTNSMDSKDKNDATQTAITEKYGMSHGRNLLRKYGNQNVNGYDNPYCRVWTYHHQYDRMTKAIRPFDIASFDMLEKAEISGNYDTVGFRTSDSKSSVYTGEVQKGGNTNVTYDESHRVSKKIDGGSKRLDKHGVLNNKTGFVNIAPTAKILDYFQGKEDDAERKAVSIKRCMFSIENLAWKNNGQITNEFNATLSPEQRGPLGGRIMWFPPYDISFNEESRVEWNGNQFIGRGEKIYTYTNTERTGSLSFTLLIDHPSILDYWTGHARNGMKNQGKNLLPGNGGGVDEIDNQENTLLRFFAGCEVLSAKPQEYWKRKNEKPKEENKEEKKDKVKKDPPSADERKTTSKMICCNLFYPNNYSGVNDDPSYAIDYLMNGFGTGYIANGGDGTKNAYSPIDSIDYSRLVKPSDFKIATTVKNTNSCDASNTCTEPCDANRTITSMSDITDWKLGYEVYEQGRGISYFKLPLSSEDDAKKANACSNSDTKARYITDESGVQELVFCPNEEPEVLAKINGISPKKSWYYRVDNDYKPDGLTYEESYLDTCSYGLNGKNFEKAREESRFKLPKDATLISFTDLYHALIPKDECNIEQDVIDNKAIEELGNIFSSEDNGYTLTDIYFIGHASYQGYDLRNDTLARNRATTIKKWLECRGVEIPNGKGEIKEPITQTNHATVNAGHNNELDVKLWRSATVYICYDVKDTNFASLMRTSSDDKVNIAIPNDTSSRPLYQGNLSINNEKQVAVAEENNEDAWMYEEINKNVENVINDVNQLETRTVNRYDNEGEFFELLDKNSPFMHHLITDKIKYFDPAYHAISPEGFNARLTFLHQCTRQGSTAENANFETSSAYNLAFGRPPVCVLRLGDFYYTKIIINSLSIQYDNPTWDLNPEGIGVMPMFAKVSLTFAFIGGSDLAGPIARLQNAVSFNYYANTSVYDNRADRVEYDPNNTGKEIQLNSIDFIS